LRKKGGKKEDDEELTDAEVQAMNLAIPSGDAA